MKISIRQLRSLINEAVHSAIYETKGWPGWPHKNRDRKYTQNDKQADRMHPVANRRAAFQLAQVAVASDRGAELYHKTKDVYGNAPKPSNTDIAVYYDISPYSRDHELINAFMAGFRSAANEN